MPIAMDYRLCLEGTLARDLMEEYCLPSAYNAPITEPMIAMSSALTSPQAATWLYRWGGMVHHDMTY